MDHDDVTEVVNRAAVPERLGEGPPGSGDLDRELSASRSTVHRALGRRSDLGVVRRDEAGYELTDAGGRRAGGEAAPPVGRRGRPRAAVRP